MLQYNYITGKFLCSFANKLHPANFSSKLPQEILVRFWTHVKNLSTLTVKFCTHIQSVHICFDG